MKLEIRETVRLYRFSDDNGNFVNIYLEPTGKNEGRIVIATNQLSCQKYYSGAGGGIYAFIKQLKAENLTSSFEISKKNQELLLTLITPIWSQFIEVL